MARVTAPHMTEYLHGQIDERTIRYVPVGEHGPVTWRATIAGWQTGDGLSAFLAALVDAPFEAFF